MSFAASEINEFLFPAPLNEVILDALYQTVRERVRFTPALPDGEADMQIYIACRRSLLKEDPHALRYALWRRFTSKDNIPHILGEIERLERHPSGWQLVPKLKNMALYFSVIREVAAQYGVQSAQVLEDDARLEHFVTNLLEDQYKKSDERITKSSLRAVAYIFCTKIVLAFILELPYDLFAVGTVHYLALGINVLFHPLVLFAMTRSMPRLDQKNTNAVIVGLRAVRDGSDIAPINIRTKVSSGFLDAVFGLLYALMFVVTFGLLYVLLRALDFNIVSMLLFLMFLALVSYFGLRIRHNAQAWKVETEQQGLASLLWNLFTLPIVRAGRALSTKFSSINIFVFTMDYLIETPFKMLLKGSDAFLSFLREKKEEISI